MKKILQFVHFLPKYKRLLLFLSACAIFMASVGGMTYAFLSYSGRARNVITTGKIDISIVEQQLSGGQYVPYPDKPVEIMPSSVVSKVVSVRCNEEEAYVRMKYSILFRDEHGRELPLDPSVIQIVPSGVNNGWVDGGDGWYYYGSAMSAGDVTDPLFDQVICSADTGNDYQNSTMIIRIHAQSVQAKNNAAPNGDVTAVRGWPWG